MNNTLTLALEMSLVPSLCLLFGGLLAMLWKPGAKLTSGTQHFAAGVVFAAVAIELLPKIIEKPALITIAVGFSIGVITMLLLKIFAHCLEEGGREANSLPLGLLTATGIDLFIDGLLIGIAFVAGKSGGVLIAFALAIEILFLGLATVGALTKRNITKGLIFIIIVLFAVFIPTGVWIGAGLMSHLDKLWLTGTIAFGVAALLYLVTEELLIEAHEVDENPLITASFFAGFLIILLLEVGT